MMNEKCPLYKVIHFTHILVLNTTTGAQHNVENDQSLPFSICHSPILKSSLFTLCPAFFPSWGGGGCPSEKVSHQAAFPVPCTKCHSLFWLTAVQFTDWIRLERTMSSDRYIIHSSLVRIQGWCAARKASVCSWIKILFENKFSIFWSRNFCFNEFSVTFSSISKITVRTKCFKTIMLW